MRDKKIIWIFQHLNIYNYFVNECVIINNNYNVLVFRVELLFKHGQLRKIVFE